MARWFLLGTLLLALGLLLILAPSDTTAVRTRKTGAKLFGGNDGYQELNEADEDDDEYTAEDQASPDEDCEDGSCEEAALPDKRRGRRVVRKAGPRGGRQQARRKMGHRMYLGEDDMKLKDSPGSWHWYLLWGSLLMGTLAVTGGGASYAYLVMKSQFLDKLKPGLMNVEKERDTNYESEETESEEEINPPAGPPNEDFIEEVKAQSEYLRLEEDFKTEPVATFAWCQSRGLLRSKCPYCEARVNHDCVTGGQFNCKACSGRVYVLEGTWFEIKPMEIWKSLAIPFHWTMGHNHLDVAKILEIPAADAALLYKKCRDVTDFCLKVCDPAGPSAGEGNQVVSKDHYVEHDHSTCPLFRLGGQGQAVEVDVVDKGVALPDKFVILCADRSTGAAMALPTKAKTAKAVEQMLKRKMKEGTNLVLPIDEQTGRENRLYVMPEFKKQLKDLLPKRQCITEDMLPVYVSQVMWHRKHEDCSYDHFRIMVNHISKYFRLGK